MHTLNEISPHTHAPPTNHRFINLKNEFMGGLFMQIHAKISKKPNYTVFELPPGLIPKFAAKQVEEGSADQTIKAQK